MNNATNKISFANFDIYEKLLEIASKHVSLSSSDDFLRLGLFGYITEGMAASIRDNALQKTMLYNESFLNTAILPESIYNYAKTFNVTVQRAVPARAMVSITIPKSDFNQYKLTYSREDYPKFYTNMPSNDNTVYTDGIIIDREGYFNVDSYVFRLEKSIFISNNTTADGGNRISAEYILTEQTGSTFYMDDPYAGVDYYKNNRHIILTEDSAGNIILHNVLVYQFDITRETLQITSDNILNKKVFYQTFNNQFANIVGSYVKNNQIIPIELYYSNLDLAFGTSIQSKYYAFYSLDSEDLIKITFSSGLKGFIPEINSQVILDIYTTSGTNINSTITGLYSYIQSNTATRAVSTLVSFESSLSGGRNTPELSQLKQQIINDISTRNIILSEDDLNNYFNILTKSWSGFDGKIKFIKKRDDILRRTFGAYSLFRSGLDTAGSPTSSSSYISTVVPTNTINAKFNIKSSDAPDNIIIKSGTKFILDTTVNNEYLFKEVTEGGNGEYDYFCPFTIRAMVSPVRLVKYISEMTDSTSSAHIVFTNIPSNYPENTTIIPRTIHISRRLNNGNGAISNSVQVELELQSNVNLQNSMSITAGGFTIKFINDDGADGAELNVGSPNIVSTQIENEESFSNIIQFSLPVSSEGIIMDPYTNNDVLQLENGTSNVKVSEEAYVEIRINGNVTNDIFDLTFRSDNKLTMFNVMDRIMTSDILYDVREIIGDSATKYIDTYRLNSIPVVHKSFLTAFQGTTALTSLTNVTGANNIKNFVKQISNHIMILKQSLNKLEANTTYDFKFYNTCGRAQYYDCMKTDLDLMLVITLTKQYIDNDSLKNQIRDYIRRYIDISNDNGEFYMSGLIVACTGAFNSTPISLDVIKNIQFVSMNGAMDDHILPFSSNVGKEYLFVPEWFTLPFNPETNEENIIFVSE